MLSYNKNVGENVGETIRKKVGERYKSIQEQMQLNPFITAAQLSEKLSVVPRTIERDLANMQKYSMIIREGSDNGGRWIVIK
ncbi:MAG: HTH domain-containing protein [Bacteroides sp.]|nr:HTH domain-containing protein [Bacteroides sp.]